MALLRITDATGREWQNELTPDVPCTIGRAPDNCVTLNDPMVSRHHAHIKFAAGRFVLVDGVLVDGVLKRSANKVFVNGKPQAEYTLADGDRVTIGKSLLRFEQSKEDSTPSLNYNDARMGRTQVTIGAREVIRQVLTASATALATGHELAALRRKAEILALLYELSQTLGSVFDLKTIFDKATDIVFRVTPADRVVALLSEGAAGAEAELRPIALRARDENLLADARRTTIGRTVTRRVIRERVALLSQDAAADSQLANVKSIIAQGVRSTICAPLATETGVHGALYADRLDPDAQFTRDDLELVSAIAAQAAVAVEMVRAHERLAREEVARANYSRFLPDHVVRQLLERPESFRLGSGTTQTLTVLFADVRGFTRLAEHTAPEQVVQLLNNYFSVMTKVIFDHGGTLDKYIGDGLMALFGAPAATPQDASRALAAAVAMQRQLETVNEQLRGAGLPEISIGIGLHTGEATVGYIGSERRTEYTAIGDTVNLAARLEQNAARGQILISEEAATQAAAHNTHTLYPRPALVVKNRLQPVSVFEVDWSTERSTPPPAQLSGSADKEQG
jgi:adenylate cyclase